MVYAAEDKTERKKKAYVNEYMCLFMEVRLQPCDRMEGNIGAEPS